MRQWLMGALAATFLVALPADAKLKSATMVVDAETGEVLQASNVDAAIYPASLTKMMTLYLLFDDLEAGKIHMGDRIPISDNAEEQAPSSLNLESGNTLSVEDAMFGMIVKSANDAAMAAGEFLGGGSETAFAERMTKRAHELGMTRTTFRNPNGLPNLEQKTTARDMATLARAMIHNHAKEYHYFSTREFTFNGQVIHGHNHLLEWYKGADGLKTGFINASGFNIVTSAKRDDRRLIAVVMGWPTWQSRDHQVAKLLNAGFARAPDTAGVEMASLPQQDEADEPVVSTRAVMKAMTKAQHKPKTQVAALRQDNSVGDIDDDEEWAVQVGSYSQHGKALQLAQVALVKMGKYGDDGEAKAVLTSKKGSKHPTFASRVVGLSKEDAQGACRSLSKKHQPCRAINLG